jgi:hypothetical protein
LPLFAFVAAPPGEGRDEGDDRIRGSDEIFSYKRKIWGAVSTWNVYIPPIWWNECIPNIAGIFHLVEPVHSIPSPNRTQERMPGVEPFHYVSLGDPNRTHLKSSRRKHCMYANGYESNLDLEDFTPKLKL